MFHRQPAEQFDEVLEINLRGSIRLARAAMSVMRPAGYGRIILVASTGGLHGDVGLSAYAASKGGLLAFGRSLAAEGAAWGVLTNMLLPYALTQMTETGMPPPARGAAGTGRGGAGADRAGQPAMHAERGVHRHRRRPAAAGVVVEWGTVELPAGTRPEPGAAGKPCWRRATAVIRGSTGSPWTPSPT